MYPAHVSDFIILISHFPQMPEYKAGTKSYLIICKNVIICQMSRVSSDMNLFKNPRFSVVPHQWRFLTSDFLHAHQLFSKHFSRAVDTYPSFRQTVGVKCVTFNKMLKFVREWWKFQQTFKTYHTNMAVLKESKSLNLYSCSVLSNVLPVNEVDFLSNPRLPP